MSDSPAATPPWMTRAATVGFAGIALALGLVGVLAARGLLTGGSTFDLWLLVAAGAGALLALVAARLSPALRVNAALTATSVIVALYGIELALFLMKPGDPVRGRAQALGRPYDGRTIGQVVSDLRAAGVDAYPRVTPTMYLAQGPDDRGFLPLSGISSVTTVHCNEMGPWLTYRSDERGFNNGPGVWNAETAIIAALGDSFTHGSCVERDLNLVGRMAEFQKSSVLNLGMGGNGPLLMLATLVEYLPAVRPEAVLWVYYEGNDLPDLKFEKRFAVLHRYLEPGSSQDLWERQSEIDAAGRALVEDGLAELPEAGLLERIFGYGRAQQRFFRQELWKLWNLRRHLGLTRSPVLDLELFRDILSRAQSVVRSWDGELYFVYLPMYRRRLDGRSRGGSVARERVIKLTRDLGIPLIDVHSFFRGVTDFDALWSGREVSPAHYSEEGYRIVASTIAEHLAGIGR